MCTVGLELEIKWPPPPPRRTGRVNAKPREKQNQSLFQKVLIMLSGMNNVNRKGFVFWLSPQRSPLISQNGTLIGFLEDFLSSGDKFHTWKGNKLVGT